MNRIDEFIAHGLLPFVGREKEMEKILAFWRSVPDAQRLRVMLLVAEAGVGKSRLLEECLQAIRSERGAVVHIKLYPEATNSLSALVSRSLWTSPSGRSILRNQPGENMPEIIAGLQRLSRLRPTLLVLEDVHLFPSESIPDLVRLFEALVDETISVLCLSRPTSFAAQGVLERYLIESLTMEGFGPEAIEQLWLELFSSPPPKGILSALLLTTKGNGLAIRSGLRGAIQNRTIVPGTRPGEWLIEESLPMFEQTLRRSVSLVVEGMVAHLTKQEREIAETLATLGEVFARETAIALDPKTDSILNKLTAQGIIVETIHPVAPLAGIPLIESNGETTLIFPASSFPLLAFTHSLLHDYLAGRTRIESLLLLQTIGKNSPLYSLLPLRRLETITLPPEIDPELITSSILRVSAVMKTLDATPEWRSGFDLVNALNRLIEHLEADSRIDERVKKQWRMHVHHYVLSTLRRSMEAPDWIALHNRQLALTDNPDSFEALRFWMLARTFSLNRVNVDMGYEGTLSIFDDVEKIARQYPEITYDVTFAYILEGIIENAYSENDLKTMYRVYEWTRELYASDDLPSRMHHALTERVLPNMLTIIQSPEELRERQESMLQIEEYESETDPHYGLAKLQFLTFTGRFEEALSLSEILLRRTSEQGLWINVVSILNRRTICAAGFGYRLEDLLEEIRSSVKALPHGEMYPPYLQRQATAFIVAGLLLNRPDQVREIITQFGFDFASIPTVFRVILTLLQGNINELRLADRERLVSHHFPNHHALLTWREVVDLTSSEHNGTTDPALSRLLDLLDRPTLHLFDIPTAWGTMSLWKDLFQAPLPDLLRRKLIEATIDRLEWLEERNIIAFMEPLIALLDMLEETERARVWKGKSERMNVQSAVRASEKTSTHAIRLSMLGTIRVAIPPEDFAPIRGVRIRTLLGLMVADRIVGMPLNQEEFLSLAGGEESDPEHARKKKNMAVVRLREIVGHDAILTDGPTPQLNLDLVSVDLLEINDLIRRALDAARQEAFVRALPLMEEALNLYHGEVPFPTLYEDFFEAARDDFEHRLRQGIIETARGIIGMGDAGGVEPFLRKAFEALPGDEEIAELLRTTLEETGNRIEAERIRMRR